MMQHVYLGSHSKTLSLASLVGLGEGEPDACGSWFVDECVCVCSCIDHCVCVCSCNCIDLCVCVYSCIDLCVCVFM